MRLPSPLRLETGLPLDQTANITVKHSGVVAFWKTVWVMLMRVCLRATLAMIVSGVLDRCYRQARSHHRNHQAFN